MYYIMGTYSLRQLDTEGYEIQYIKRITVGRQIKQCLKIVN